MTPTATTQRRALIVATGVYDDPKLRRLRAPAADAEQLAAVLRDPAIGDFEVEIAKDCAESDLRRRIARFFRAGARDDVLLVHVSGHGIKDARGTLFLAASDTELDLLDATAISASWLDQQMTQSPSRSKLLLLDCCFSGKFPFNSTARSGDSVEVEERLQGRGRAVITASNSMEYAYEGDELSGEGQPSYFTAAIVEALTTGEADRDQDHWITVDELYEYVYDRVKERSPEQTPNKQIALEGPLYVARSSFEHPVAPATLDPQLLDLLEHPVGGARLGAVEDLADLLTASNPGVALAARHALERMRDDDSRKVADRARVVLGEAAVPEAPSPPHTKKRVERKPDVPGDPLRLRPVGRYVYAHPLVTVALPLVVVFGVDLATPTSETPAIAVPFSALVVALVGIGIAKGVGRLMRVLKSGDGE